VHHLSANSERDVAMHHEGHRQQPQQAALEVADVVADPVGDEQQHVVGHAGTIALAAQRLRRMAMRVSRSGCWTSQLGPD